VVTMPKNNGLFEEAKKRYMPLFKALPRDGMLGGTTFWCPYCRKWHLHGVNEKGDTSAHHKSPHCGVTGEKGHGYASSEENPLEPHGYYVKMASKTELRLIMKTIKKYLDWLEVEDDGHQ